MACLVGIVLTECTPPFTTMVALCIIFGWMHTAAIGGVICGHDCCGSTKSVPWTWTIDSDVAVTLSELRYDGKSDDGTCRGVSTPVFSVMLPWGYGCGQG